MPQVLVRFHFSVYYNINDFFSVQGKIFILYPANLAPGGEVHLCFVAGTRDQVMCSLEKVGIALL